MLDLADAVSRIDPQEAMGYGRQMGFDPATIALLQKGRGELERLLKTQKELAVYTKEDAEIAKKAQIATQTFMQGLQALGVMIMRIVGPAISWLSEALADFVGWVRDNGKSVAVFLAALGTGDRRGADSRAHGHGRGRMGRHRAVRALYFGDHGDCRGY